MENTERYILCVDDDSDDRFIIAECLAKLRPQYKLHFAENGLHALQFLRSTQIKPFCIFIDINMPILDGYKLLSMIKADQTLIGVSCYILSTSANLKDKQYAKKLGAEGYITKPSDFASLTHVLEESLKNVELKLKT